MKSEELEAIIRNLSVIGDLMEKKEPLCEDSKEFVTDTANRAKRALLNMPEITSFNQAPND